jgi:hypothetical protein
MEKMTLTEWLEQERKTCEDILNDWPLGADRFLAGYYGAIINTLEFLSGPTTTENN